MLSTLQRLRARGARVDALGRPLTTLKAVETGSPWSFGCWSANNEAALKARRWPQRANLWRERTNLRKGSVRLKNKHLLPPPQSEEELMELKLDDATEFVAALTGERHD